MDLSSKSQRVERALPRYRPNRNALMRLFCFPYAGGSTVIFSELASMLTANGFDICCVELPGRGNRFDEAAIDDIKEMVAHAAEVVGALDSLPYALLGYSMGATIAYELAHLLVEQGRALPRRLFLAATSPPETRDEDERLHVLNDDDLIAKLSEYNGTPQELLDHKELMALLLPAIRADFKLIETHSPERIVPLPIPIDVIIGSADSGVDAEDAVQWQNHTIAGFKLHLIEGDHFFILSAADRLASIIRQRGM